MAVGYRSSSSSGTADTNGTSCTIPVPAGAASGDIAIIGMEQWETYDITGSITWPTGFTGIAGATGVTAGGEKLRVAWKRLTAADTGNYVVTWTGTQWDLGHCVLITGGIVSGDPVDAAHSISATGTTMPALTLTTTTDAFIVHFVARENSGSGTAPTSFTRVQESQYLTTSYRIPGSTGTVTPSGGTCTSSNKWGGLVAIKPEPTGGGSFTGSGSVAETASLSAAGVKGVNAGATVAETATVTAAGSTGISAGGGSVAETVALTAAGFTGTSKGGGTEAVTAALTAAGTVTAGFTGSGARDTTVAVTAAGTVATSTGAARAESVTLTAAGVVNVTASATVTETTTLTAAGQVGKVATATVTETVTLSAAGDVTSGSVVSSRSSTVTLTAAGVVAKTGSASLSTLAALSAAGVVSDPSFVHPTGALVAAITSANATARVTSVNAAGVVTTHNARGLITSDNTEATITSHNARAEIT